jgi:hypothetical protein
VQNICISRSLPGLDLTELGVTGDGLIPTPKSLNAGHNMIDGTAGTK